MKDPLQPLGKFLEKTNFYALPKRIRDHAKIVLLDTIGAILGGMGFKEMINLSKSIAQLSRPGPASVFGKKMKVQPPFAALIHGSAGTWLELDEGNRFAMGHPGIHVVPAAMAMGEALKASGKEFLTALILGYEVAARVGAASKLRSGVQPHGTWGTPGAAVAAGKLLGLKSRDFHSIINLVSHLFHCFHDAGSLRRSHHTECLRWPERLPWPSGTGVPSLRLYRGEGWSWNGLRPNSF